MLRIFPCCQIREDTYYALKKKKKKKKTQKPTDGSVYFYVNKCILFFFAFQHSI